MIRKRNQVSGSIVALDKNAKHERRGSARVIATRGLDYSAPFMELINKAQDSQQLQDPFLPFYQGDAVATSPVFAVQPVFSFTSLIRVFMESTILRQCVESYVVNIESYGHVLEYIGNPKDRKKPEVAEEKIKIEAILAGISPDKTLTEVRQKSRWDMEVLGNRAFEVIRTRKGAITMFDHMPMSTVRMTRCDTTPTKTKVTSVDPNDPSKVTTRTVERFFRRYVQVNAVGKKVYFKEFGDPRSIDPTNGKENTALAIEDQATEVYFESQYIPGNVYGLPRWLGTLPAILGSKESELVNLNFFRDNAIPAMAVMVSNGALTNESFDKLQEYFLAIKGQKSMNRVILLEAASDDSGGSTDHSQPAPKITMQPLISERQQEGLFQGYDNNNQQKVRSSFRLPPIYVGRAEDYTRASAVASMLLAENQVFFPERQAFDFVMNQKILSTHGVKYWRFKSVGAPITDAESVTSMISTMSEEGALTPNLIIKLANQFLNAVIEPRQEAWADVPFSAIKLMLQNGVVIDGFDDFIVSMGDEGGDTQDTNPPAKKPAKGKAKGKATPPAGAKVDQATKNYVRKVVKEMVQDVNEQLQTFAKANKNGNRSRSD